LALLKSAISPYSLEWLSWRRFSDLPRDPPESSACARFTQGGSDGATLRYSSDYCGSGVVDQYGSIEENDSVSVPIADHLSVNPVEVLFHHSSVADACEGEPLCMTDVRVHILPHGASFDLNTRRASPPDA